MSSSPGEPGTPIKFTPNKQVKIDKTMSAITAKIYRNLYSRQNTNAKITIKKPIHNVPKSKFF
jgi:hypothetical protein